jgi:hypothetical protein
MMLDPVSPKQVSSTTMPSLDQGFASPSTETTPHRTYTESLAAFEFSLPTSSPHSSPSGDRPSSIESRRLVYLNRHSNELRQNEDRLGRTTSVRSARSTLSSSTHRMGTATSTLIGLDEPNSAQPSRPQPRTALSSTSTTSSSSSGSVMFDPSRRARLSPEDLPGSRILQKLDALLGTEELDSDAPSVLDHPPRQLLLHTPVLQVVNVNTVKDRHLFLFNDLLLIAKPLIEEDPITSEPLPVTLDNSFVVKSIVELSHLKLAPPDEAEDSIIKKRHPLLIAFVDRFSNDPQRAIAGLLQNGGLINDEATIANLLFRNPDLNRNQLGAYLCLRENKQILRSYVERFRLGGIRLDDALRIFLMSIRLPHDLVAAEYVLGVVASQWTEVNGFTGFEPTLTLSLVLAIMRLSDALHSGLSTEEGIFSFPNSAVTVDDFIAAFREHDLRSLVPEEYLTRIYESVRNERIEQASDNSMFSMTPDIEATLHPPRLPSRLTYRIPSDSFSISIPEPDAKFAIKLQGKDLKFDPPYLSFSTSATQSFKVIGTALGTRVMVLIKVGVNARRYNGLPLNKVFRIERAFMQNTFQIGFINHLEVKRKYMFSTPSVQIRNEWFERIKSATEARLKIPLGSTKAIRGAELVAIQVLRDALIAPEEINPPLTSFTAHPRMNSAAPSKINRRALGSASTSRAGTAASCIKSGAVPMSHARSNSISKTYANGMGKGETDLNENQNRRGSPGGQPSSPAFGRNASLINTTATATTGGREDEWSKKGTDIQLITEQNSLLPLVLSFLRAGTQVRYWFHSLNPYPSEAKITKSNHLILNS